MSYGGERETRVTVDKAQWTMGKRKRKGEVISFPPFFARKFHRERDVWKRARHFMKFQGPVVQEK